MLAHKSRRMAIALFMLLTFTMFLTMGCNMIGNLMGGGGGEVKELWADVPQMEGLKAESLDLPIAARLAIQAAFQGAIDYASYTTDKTPADVQAYYTPERMTEAGWSDDSGMGCVGDNGTDPSSSGAVCFFVKEQNGKKEALAIVSAVDDSTKKTQVFFARIDVSKLETPTP